MVEGVPSKTRAFVKVECLELQVFPTMECFDRDVCEAVNTEKHN